MRWSEWSAGRLSSRPFFRPSGQVSEGVEQASLAPAAERGQALIGVGVGMVNVTMLLARQGLATLLLFGPQPVLDPT